MGSPKIACMWTVAPAFAASLDPYVNNSSLFVPTAQIHTIYSNGSTNAVNGLWPASASADDPDICPPYAFSEEVLATATTVMSGKPLTHSILLDFEHTDYPWQANYFLPSSLKEDQYVIHMSAIAASTIAAAKRLGYKVSWWDSIQAVNQWVPSSYLGLIDSDPIKKAIRAAVDFNVLSLNPSGQTAGDWLPQSLSHAYYISNLEKKPVVPVISLVSDAAELKTLIKAVRQYDWQPAWWAFPTDAGQVAALTALADNLLSIY